MVVRQPNPQKEVRQGKFSHKQEVTETPPEKLSQTKEKKETETKQF
jgi:hypothetical protein